MKYRILLSTLLAVCVLATHAASVPNLWPMPQSFQSGNNVLKLEAPCQLNYFIHSPVAEQHHVYYASVFKFFEKLQLNEHCKKYWGREIISSISWKGSHFETEYPTSAIHITVRDPQDIPLVIGTTDESYNLTIDANGTNIQAATFVAMARALMTLNQLLETQNQAVIVNNAPVSIIDFPRYAYRGVMIDTSRHFISVKVLIDLIDAMAANKLNAFHWHISDSDSFPMEMPSHPNMTNAAFSKKQIYTRQDVNKIVEHAKSRGVAVIPELDTPSHTRSFVEAPEWKGMITCLKPGYPWAGTPIGMLDVTQDKTYTMIGELYDDLQKGYFSEFQYLHVGTDEVFQDCVTQIPNINEFLATHGFKDYKDVFNYYVQRTADLVDNRTTRIAWSNSDTFFLQFRETDVLQWWGTSEDLPKAFQQYPKNKFILSNYDYFYLDCGYENVMGAASWCKFSTWKNIYRFEADSILPNEDWRQRVLGGEVAMWEEIGNDFTIGPKVWPKGIAFAERFWSAKDNVGNSDLDMFSRMNAQNDRLLKMGMAVTPISSGYCEVHPDHCFKP